MHIPLALLLGLVSAQEAPPAPSPEAPVPPIEQDEPVLPPPPEEPPPPPIVLREVPPRASWDLAVVAGFTTLPQFQGSAPWMLLGVRGGLGRHTHNGHRFGGTLAFSFEGPIGVEWTNHFELHGTWDHVTKGRLWLGASVGTSLGVSVAITAVSRPTTTIHAAPYVAFRIGYSQPWSLIKRHFSVAVEPRFRWIAGSPQFGAAVVIGGGRGW